MIRTAVAGSKVKEVLIEEPLTIRTTTTRSRDGCVWAENHRLPEITPSDAPNDMTTASSILALMGPPHGLPA
jgi:hypothetical protein